MSSQKEQAYSNIVTMLEGLLDFHPEMVTLVSDGQRSVLEKFYFFNKPVEVDDIKAYRRQLMADEPSLEPEAEEALRAFLAAAGVAGDPAKPGDWVS